MIPKKELLNIIYFCLDKFSEKTGFYLSSENTKIALFTPKTGVKVYENFCKDDFPKNLKENYMEEGYFEGFDGQAFVGEAKYGLFIRSNLDISMDAYMEMILHECSHIFCTVNEIATDDFYDRYCLQEGVKGDNLYNGYAIWREAIADIFKDILFITNKVYYLSDVKRFMTDYETEFVREPNARKTLVAQLISVIVIYTNMRERKNWGETQKLLKESKLFQEETLYSLLEKVFAQLKKDKFWEIDEDYIASLGRTYSAYKEEKDRLNFARRIGVIN